MKRYWALITAIILISAVGLFFSACQPQEESAIGKGDRIRYLDGVEIDYANMFFDDFTNGVDYDSWYIGKQAWGSNENGGVIPENVNYTDEGVLVFTGNGDYYASGDVAGVGARKDGSLTGGVLISKFVTGPGRYQTKMKVLPRLGACSAFWTYCFESETGGNHEIDIELPGGKDHSEVITFENVLNTNYITVEMNESQDVNVSEAHGTDKTVALNDGEWHTFGFDWYTDPEMVVYYVDGIVTAVSRLFVPYVQARVWLGVWFPNNTGFVGDAEFESDVMSVDYVQYIPFLNQPCREYNPPISSSQVATREEYPQAPVSDAHVNKIANGNFEYVADHRAEGYGWNFVARDFFADEETELRKSLREQIAAENPDMPTSDVNKLANERLRAIKDEAYAVEVSDMCFIDENLGNFGSCGVKLKDLGALSQIVDGVYADFQLDLKFSAKGNGKILLQFQTEKGLSVLQEAVYAVDSEKYTKFDCQSVAPQGTRQITVYIVADYGEEIFADDFVLNIN